MLLTHMRVNVSRAILEVCGAYSDSKKLSIVVSFDALGGGAAARVACVVRLATVQWL